MTAPAPAPECPLPPQVWRGRELAQAQERTLATGHAALDAQLPGGGWPLGSLVEVLQQEQQQHVWQLLGPALAQAMQARGEPAVLVDAPYQPFGPSLRALGIVPERLLCVRADKPAARLWAAEQSLRCADVCAVLAWLPQARVGELRRLQLAAAQHESLLFVFRPANAAASTSPARLRLQLMACEGGSAQIDVHILKRRGPPLASPIRLPARSQRMTALLAASQLRRKLLRQEGGAPQVVQGATVVRLDFHQRHRDALDRTALAA